MLSSYSIVKWVFIMGLISGLMWCVGSGTALEIWQDFTGKISENTPDPSIDW